MKFQVVVNKTSPNSRAFIKALRAVAPMSTRRATALEIYLGRFKNSALVAGVDQVVAEQIAGMLIECGAIAHIEGSSMTSPMLLCAASQSKSTGGKWRKIEGCILNSDE